MPSSSCADEPDPEVCNDFANALVFNHAHSNNKPVSTENLEPTLYLAQSDPPNQSSTPMSDEARNRFDLDYFRDREREKYGEFLDEIKIDIHTKENILEELAILSKKRSDLLLDALDRTNSQAQELSPEELSRMISETLPSDIMRLYLSEEDYKKYRLFELEQRNPVRRGNLEMMERDIEDVIDNPIMK